MEAVNLSEDEKKKIISVKDFLSVPELFQVLAEIEPIYREGKRNLNQVQENRLEDAISNLGLEIRFYDESTGKSYYIGQSIDLIQGAHKARKKENYQNLGKLLGYPECCTKNFLNSHHQEDTRTKILPYSCDNQLKEYDYRTNSIYHPSNYRRDDKLYSYIENFPYSKNYFISHVPCSYDCRESLKLGRDTEEVLMNNFPVYSKNIKESLQKGFILLDKLEFIVISFELEEGKIKYEIDTSTPLVSEDELAEFRKYEYIEIEDEDSIILYKEGGEEGKRIDRTIVLFN